MNKKEIRALYKQKRSYLSDEERKDMLNKIYSQFTNLSLVKLNVVHHYLAVTEQFEISVEKILDLINFKFQDIIMVVPVMKGEDMISVIYHKNMTVAKNKWGIPEPVDLVQINDKLIDCVLVPLLAFDHHGNRVGYGKGCYDRFLARCRKDIIKIGFSFFDPVDSIDDTDKFDIPLNYCITPEHIYEFG